MTYGYVLRDARLTDLTATAALHVQELPVGLFPRLGRRFVARWHRAFVQSPHAVAVVAVGPDPRGCDRVVGFLLGATDRRAFRRDVLSEHGWALFGYGVVTLALRPLTLVQFLRTRLGPYLQQLWPSSAAARRTDGGARSRTVGDLVGELTAVAVAPSIRRDGAGRTLVEEFLDRCAAAGTPAVELVTATSSATAVAFYVNTGWTRLGSCATRDGVPVQRFGRRLDVTEGVPGNLDHRTAPGAAPAIPAAPSALR